jgi:hypothetical protein
MAPELETLELRKSLPTRTGLTLLMFFCAVIAKGAPESVRLHGSVIDENGKPVAEVEVKIQQPSGQIKLAHTDIAGAFEFSFESAGPYSLSLNKAGFFRMEGQKITLREGDNPVALSINNETEIHEQIEVYSTPETILPLETAHRDSLIAREIRDIPVAATNDFRNSLTILPEVVSDRADRLHIAGGRTAETQYLLDGFEIGDPVTGNLSVRVNVDNVRMAEVESGRFSPQYGNAGAGVLSIDTITGDDRWRIGATDFLPGFSADRGIHFSSWYPRLTISGPLRKDRAWFSEALSIQRTVSLVRELPRHENSVTQWAGDSMFRTQIRLSPKNMLQGNFLYNQRNVSNLGLGPFSPISTTRGLQAYRSFISVKDQVWSGRNYYEIGLAADIGHDESLPQGFEPFLITPSGSAGNYFESMKRQTRRWQGFGNITLPARGRRGNHDIQFGFNAATKGWTQSSQRNAIEVQRADRTLVQRTLFSGQSQFHLSDTFLGGYGMDTWRIAKTLVLQLALRADWDRIISPAPPSPRIAVNFLPFHSETSKFTAAWGIYLQPMAFSSFGPANDQQRSDTYYNRTGDAPISTTISRFALPVEPLKQARFYSLSFGWEQTIGKKSKARINFAQRNERFGLAYDRANADPNINRFVLQNNRQDNYRSIQFSLQHSFNDRADLSCSYTRSRARTNQLLDYSLESTVFSPQQSGPLEWDAPNRFISSGWTTGPAWGLFLSYFFEYRTGFPFSQINERQQLVGLANRLRFPKYVSLNLGIEKHVRLLSRTWAVRLTILNLTNNSNPNSVINNIDSPDFMKFGGSQKNTLNVRIRLVG